MPTSGIYLNETKSADETSLQSLMDSSSLFCLKEKKMLNVMLKKQTLESQLTIHPENINLIDQRGTTVIVLQFKVTVSALAVCQHLCFLVHFDNKEPKLKL